MFAGIAEWYRGWKTARRERRIARLTRRSAGLSEDEEHDLVFLHHKGFVRARATGQTITDIRGVVESLVRKRLRVVIKPGTYFVAKGNYQNMVTRTEYSFTLEPCATRSVSIKASCINAGLPIPEEKDRFHGVKRVSDDLVRFLEAASGAGPMVIQAGVWALTDNYTGYDVKTRLVARDRDGNTRQAVSDADVDEAKRILDGLGIRHRL